MSQPDLFEKGLFFFNAGRYFEAHEAWEDLWRITDGPAKTFYQGLIQAAVGLHHLERANLEGFRGQVAKAIGHLLETPANPQAIDTPDLIRQLQEIQEQMRSRSVRITRLK